MQVIIRDEDSNVTMADMLQEKKTLLTEIKDGAPAIAKCCMGVQYCGRKINTDGRLLGKQANTMTVPWAV